MIISELPSSVAVLPIVADGGLASATTGDWPSQPPTKLTVGSDGIANASTGDWPTPPQK